jgi:hypothetical protein
MPEDLPDRMPENMPDKISENLPDRMPENIPEDMAKYMPEDMPDRMPNRMPEDMSDRMPEDLPVRKYINAMVGIIRNKIILLKYLFFFSKILFYQNIIILNIYYIFPGTDVCINSYIDIINIFLLFQNYSSWIPSNYFSIIIISLELLPPVSGPSVRFNQWISKKIPKIKY